MSNLFDSDTAVLERKVETKDFCADDAGLLRQSAGYLVLKRLFDFTASFCISLILLLPLAILAVMVYLADPGAPFYIQERVGKNGKVLPVMKLRTMRIGADRLEEMLTPEQLEQYRKEYKLEDDPRLIGYRKAGDGRKCFGALLRRTSLDELPQIVWNICLRGDMSLVGPRPILADELEKNYTPAEQKRLLSVKPGLTGYWQAYARNNVHYEDGRRQAMELYYVENASLMLDLKIIFATVGAVLTERGAQ